MYYWQDSAPGITEPAPTAPPPRPKARRHGEKKSSVVEKQQSKPQGPLIISISIAQQRLRLYDANGLFAETPVSTGMVGHSTPMGVFSVIQKQKFHQSNIYSGAPMPYMQRITWSGIAMHAGVLPGHPASHGCIRMPMAFAIKMYGWTRMGARVIVTPGDVTPASFSHPLLATIKVQPQPVAVGETKADVVAVQRPEKQVDARGLPAVTEAKLELRPTVGHVDDMKPAAVESRPLASSQLKTADTSGAPQATLSTPEPAASEALKPNGTSMDAAVNSSPLEAKTNAETDGQAEEPADTAKLMATMPAALPVAASSTALKDDLKSDFAKTADFRSDLDPGLKNTGQVAVFVSRKDSKLYVRQNFSPLFDVPVTIAAEGRPLGTHIFTARVDKNDANVLHWSVVSLPALAKAANRRAEEERSSRGRRIASAGPIEAKSLPVADGPAEALDRLNLPADIMKRIYEAVSTGGSIIVSDQGIAAGETGEGTDFIVSLH